MVVTLFLPQKKKSSQKKNVKLMGILSPKIKIFQLKLLTAE